MKHLIITACLFIFALATSGQLRYSETIFKEANTIKNVEFAVSNWLDSRVSLIPEYDVHEDESKTESRPLFMDIYLPKADTVNLRPAILFAFSGGFITGSRHNDDMVAFCDSFAQRGYVCATFDYRIGMGADVDKILGIPYHVSVSDDKATRSMYRAVQDSRAAVRFLKHNAENYGIDTTKIFMVGSSAGGFVALHNLYMNKPDEIPASVLSEPSLGHYDSVGIQGYDGRANAIVSLWGAIRSPSLIEEEHRPALLIHGEDDNIVFFKKGMPLKAAIPETNLLDYDVSETYGGFCIDTALLNRNIPHETYFVAGKRHEFYGVDTGEFKEDGPNEYWDTIHWKISDFFFDIIKPEARFVATNSGHEVRFSNLSNSKYYAHWDFGDNTYSNDINPVHLFNEPGYHKVKLTTCNENMACDTLTKTIFLNPLAVNDFSWQKIYIFPNPAKNRLTIKGIQSPYSIKIFDLSGRIQLSLKVTQSEYIDLSELNAGMYIVKIENRYGVSTHKMQKVN